MERGTQTAPGTAARYRLDASWTPELVEAMPPDWRPRLELAWASLRLGASDQLVGGCLRRSPAASGDRALWAWYCSTVRSRHSRQRKRARAQRAAAERADRGHLCGAGEVLAGAPMPPAEVAGGNSTPPGTEPSPSAPKGPSGLAPRNALAREARRGKPPQRQVSGDQLRLVVEAGLVAEVSKAGEWWAELAQVAELVGEADPVAVWGQLVRLATRHGQRLGDLVGGYQRAVDRVRRDIVPAAAAAGEPVENPAALACYWLRRELAAGDQAPVEPVPAIDAAGPLAEPELEGPPPPGPYVPEPERCLTAEERRAIRARVEAERRAVAERAAPAPAGRLAALLERARAERRKPAPCA